MKYVYEMPNSENKETTMIILDTETTGLSPKREEIVNLAIMGVTDTMNPTFIYDWWGIPSYRFLPAELVNKTGLSNTNVITYARGELFRNHVPDILETLHHYSDKILLGQNVKFDIGFVKELKNVYNLNSDYYNPSNTLELMDVYRTEFSGRRNLDEQMKETGVTPSIVSAYLKMISGRDLERHTGAYDVVATFLVLRKLMERKNIKSVTELYNIFK